MIGETNEGSATSNVSRNVSAQNNANAGSSSPRKPFLSLKSLFGSKEKSTAKGLSTLITSDGSIRQITWEGISKNSPIDKRVETLKQLKGNAAFLPSIVELPVKKDAASASFLNRMLSDFFKLGPSVIRSRSLQVSTLEGIYHDTKDMLNDSDTKEPVLRLIIELTETQHDQLGLALRHTFFEEIRAMGCEELTLKWLLALSDRGRNVNGFEKDMDNLILEWLQMTLTNKEPAEALLVLDLTKMFIIHNSAFISTPTLTEIVQSVCITACKAVEHLTKDCLGVLECVLKYSELPRTQLVYVTFAICIQVCDAHFRQQSWLLARALLTSQLGHRTRKQLQLILEQSSSFPSDVPQAKRILVLRGAVFCLANAIWGTSQVDAIRCSPSSIIPSMEKAIAADWTVCSDVLLSLRRLIQKHGRDLQQMTWVAIMGILGKATDLVEKRPEYAEHCDVLIQQLLQLSEEFYRIDGFSACPEMLFALIERCADRRPDSSIMALIDYTIKNVSPMVSDWLERVLRMVRTYCAETQVPDRRLKSLSALHSVYTKYRVLFEHDLITQLMLPVLRDSDKERDSNVQYQMINILFDVAKTVSLRGEGLLFMSIISQIRQLFNSSILQPSSNKNEDDSDEMEVQNEPDSQCNDDYAYFTIDNLIVMAGCINELLTERWVHLNHKHFTSLVALLCEHIETQYSVGFIGDQGAEVRVLVMNAILTIYSCPMTKRMLKLAKDENEMLANFNLKRKCEENDVGFTWSYICRTVAMVLSKDTSWSVIQCTLQRLGRTLENTELILTANMEEMDHLVDSLIGLYQRSERKEFTSEPDDLAKFLPPVLATLLNYNLKPENKNRDVCRILVDCLRGEHIEALMACDVAVQLTPTSMQSFAHVILKYINTFEPSAKKAVPLIEFMSDCADIYLFYEFFQDKHFRMIIDLLIPYADVRKFNIFIVTCVHRLIMKWYSKVPDAIRSSFQSHAEQCFRDIPLLSCNLGMHRLPSGDGRQVPGNIFLLGGDPGTPPPMDGCNAYKPEKGVEKITAEVQKALNVFFRFGLIEDEKSQQSLVPDNFTVSLQEHYYSNDCIISLISMYEKHEEGDSDVFLPTDDESQATNNEFVNTGEFRRRYQSAVHDRRTASLAKEMVHKQSKALDDSYTSETHCPRLSTNKKDPTVMFTKLIIRHMYGMSTWLMRSFDDIPDDFEKSAAFPASAASLLLHLNNSSGLGFRKLGKKNEDDLARSLRNLDRTFGIELHAVGVVYLSHGQMDDQAEILSNTNGSERYSRFIRLLGGPTTLEKSPGGLMEGTHGGYTLEYKDELAKIVFLIATLMPNQPNDINRNSKKKLIANNFVSIFFNESGRPFKLGSVCGQFAHVTIEITPCDSKNVVLTVHAKPEISCWLAMKKVLLNDRCASSFVRSLVIRAELSVNVWRSMQEDSNNPYISKGVDRLRRIHDIRDKMI